MNPPSFLDAIKASATKTTDGNTLVGKLRRVPDSDRHDRSAANPMLAAQGEMDAEQEATTRNTFFRSGVDTWYGMLEGMTPSTSFCDLRPEEAKIIVEHWKRQTTGDVAAKRMEESELALFDRKIMDEAKIQLGELQRRLEKAVKAEVTRSPASRAFVKLSTRSPKDSKLVLSKAAMGYKQSVSRRSHEPETLNNNMKWIILSEEVANASAVDDASSALDLLLDSYRVYQDLEYALEGLAEDDGTSEKWNVSLVARAWDPRISPQSEFRAICWDGKMTCLCQYFHPLYFPSIVDRKDEIQDDILNCFNKPNVREAVSQLGGDCIVDFAWIGPADVLIVELNPFDGVGLGTFPASTGLFLWDDPTDRRIMQGIEPFEFRVRTVPVPEKELKVGFHRGWRSVIYDGTV